LRADAVGVCELPRYATSGFIAIILAEYIRRLGYPAKAHYAPFYDIVLPPILLWAGLGEMSRIGDTVLHPFIGPRHLHQGLPLEQALHPFPPIGQLDDAERGHRPEFWHLER
jgi:hypothetical protein